MTPRPNDTNLVGGIMAAPLRHSSLNQQSHTQQIQQQTSNASQQQTASANFFRGVLRFV